MSETEVFFHFFLVIKVWFIYEIATIQSQSYFYAIIDFKKKQDSFQFRISNLEHEPLFSLVAVSTLQSDLNQQPLNRLNHNK